MSKSILRLTRKKQVRITLACACGINIMEKVCISSGFVNLLTSSLLAGIALVYFCLSL